MSIEFRKDGHDYEVIDDCCNLIGIIKVYTSPPFDERNVYFDTSSGYEHNIKIENVEQILAKMKELQSEVKK